MASQNPIEALVEALKKAIPQITAPIPNSPVYTSQLKPFHPAQESFSTYLKRVNTHFQLRGLTGTDAVMAKTKLHVFLDNLDLKSHEKLVKLVAPADPASKTFDIVVELLSKHLEPAPSVIAEHRFSNRLQGEIETIAGYEAELRNVAVHCKYKCTSCQASTDDQHLRTLIRGLRDSDIRGHLLLQKRNRHI